MGRIQTASSGICNQQLSLLKYLKMWINKALNCIHGSLLRATKEWWKHAFRRRKHVRTLSLQSRTKRRRFWADRILKSFIILSESGTKTHQLSSVHLLFWGGQSAPLRWFHWPGSALLPARSTRWAPSRTERSTSDTEGRLHTADPPKLSYSSHACRQSNTDYRQGHRRLEHIQKLFLPNYVTVDKLINTLNDLLCLWL